MKKILELLRKIKACRDIFQNKSVIFNVEIYGKVRIRMKKSVNVIAYNCKFIDDFVTDKVIVLPDDLGKMPTEEAEEKEILGGNPL